MSECPSTSTTTATVNLSRQELLEEYRRKKKEEKENSKGKKKLGGISERVETTKKVSILRSKTVATNITTTATVPAKSTHKDQVQRKNEQFPSGENKLKVSSSRKSEYISSTTRVNSKLKISSKDVSQIVSRGQKENIGGSFSDSQTTTKMKGKTKTPLKERVSSLTASAKKAMKKSANRISSNRSGNGTSESSIPLTEKGQEKKSAVITERQTIFQKQQQMVGRTNSVRKNDQILKSGLVKDNKKTPSHPPTTFSSNSNDGKKVSLLSHTSGGGGTVKSRSKSEIYVEEKLNEVKKLIDLTFLDAAKALLSELKRDANYRSILLGRARYWILLSDINRKQSSNEGGPTSGINVKTYRETTLEEGIFHMKRATRIEKQELQELMSFLSNQKQEQKQNLNQNENNVAPTCTFSNKNSLNRSNEIKSLLNCRPPLPPPPQDKCNEQNQHTNKMKNVFEKNDTNPKNEAIPVIPLKGRVAHLKSLFEKKCQESATTTPALSTSSFVPVVENSSSSNNNNNNNRTTWKKIPSNSDLTKQT